MEQQLYFISGIAGATVLLLANIMGYYILKFKRNFKEEQISRIKYETESEQLQHELATIQAEFDEEKSKVNHLQENLDAERESWLTESEQLRHESATIQAELEQKQNKVNRLEENLEAAQASRIQYQTESERLQRELNTTQVTLEQNQNEVCQLQQNLQAERASWITESEQLQHELATIQAELEQKQNKVNRLEENLEAAQASRIQYQTESERLQPELATTQAELQETQTQLKQKQNEVNQLQQSLQAEQAESEQLQAELNTTQVELREKENEVNHLQENLQTERESRIQYQTESGNLQRELSTSQAELEQKESEISRLQQNLQAGQVESQRLQHELNTTQAELEQNQNEVYQLQENLEEKQAESERLQGELNTTQVELEETQAELQETQTELEKNQREVNQLQQNLQVERAESERLQRELNANQAELEETQAELEKNQNEVKHLEKNLETKQAESEQLQRELNTTQEELDGKENKVNRLEENLQAEQQSRIQYETESQQLQHELATIYQTKLDKQKNIINRLEENLNVEQQSRIQYEKKVEKLQHELTTTQTELNKQKNIINRLEEKIKEKSANRASTEQSDIQEGEENSTDSNELQNQENTGVERDSQIDSAGARSIETKNKTGQTGNTKAPQNRGGLRGPGSNGSEGSTDHQTEYNPKPELACRKNGWQWEILLVVPQEQPPVEVQQNGARLSGSNGKYRLTDFSEDVTIMYGDNEETVEVYNDKSPLIFKLRKRWKGDGQKVGGLSCGYFIVFTPNDWSRTGKPPVVEEACSDAGFSAHYFYSDGSSTDDGFEGHKLPSKEEGFSLEGSSIYDDSDQGPLFIGNPPSLVPVKDVFWARIGAEGVRDWKGENFKPADKTVKEVLNGQQGWFYVRVYDEAVQLMDSDHFRYSQTLKEIRVDGTIYSEKMLLVPSGGHRKTTIQFIDTEGKNIRPEQKGSSPYTSINDDGEAIVARHPDADLTEWKVGGVDTVIVLPRVWWRITETDEFLDVWRDKPIDMSREEFRENEDAIVQFSLPSNIQQIQAGFGSDLDRLYSTNFINENESKRIFELPMRDFVDYEEINTRLLEDTYLQVQCNREVIPIIRVSAEEPLLQEIRVNGTIYSEGMLLVPSIDKHGKTTGYGETIIEFIDTGGRNIHPKKKGNNSHASIRNDGAVIVEPTPDGESTEWEVGSVDKVLSLPSVWWRITETEEWRATSVDMSHAEFRENTDLLVQISLPSSIRAIQAGFGCNLQRSYTGSMDSANENKRIFELSIRDFVNFEEINTQLLEDTHLQIQCNGEVIPIIRVPAEKCSECGSTQITEKRYPTEQRIELFCRTCESKWQIDNTIVSIAEPQSAKQQITGE